MVFISNFHLFPRFIRVPTIKYRGYNIKLGSFENEQEKKDVMIKARPYILQWTSEKRSKMYVVHELERLGIRKFTNEGSDEDDDDNHQNGNSRQQSRTTAADSFSETFNRTTCVGVSC